MKMKRTKSFQQNENGLWKDEKLSDLFTHYLDNSLLVLDFCSAVDGGLKRAGHLASFIDEACRKFEDEHCSNGEEASVKDYSTTLQELRDNVRMVGDPFRADFFDVFNQIYSHQILLQKRLHKKTGELKTWRKVSDVIVAAAKPLLRKKYLWDLRLKDSMQRGIYVVANNLNTIGRLAEIYQSHIDSFFLIVDYIILREGDVVVIEYAVKEIKRSLGEFVRINQDLIAHVDHCRRSLRLLINIAAEDRDIGMFQEERFQSRIIQLLLEGSRPLRTPCEFLLAKDL